MRVEANRRFGDVSVCRPRLSHAAHTKYAMELIEKFEKISTVGRQGDKWGLPRHQMVCRKMHAQY
jgi:hypothetical protein